MAVWKIENYFQVKMMDHCHSLVADKEVDLNSLFSVHSFLVNQSGISCLDSGGKYRQMLIEIYG